MIKSLSILGLRGFATRQTLEFAIPNGKPGSGLTILVGANNAGKSTAVEALRALAANSDISITRGKRNEIAGDRVEITVTSLDGQTFTLKSSSLGSSETERTGEYPNWAKTYAVPSRRTFSPYFSKSEWDRDTYRSQHGLPAVRAASSNNFSYRLFAALKQQDKFNKVLGRVIDPIPVWTIDQEDSGGNHFIKIKTGNSTHSSEGAGEGFVSLLYLIDAFYDISEEEMIAIDEPELSLYPAVQRKLSKLISEYAAKNQVVIATHSPYFVDIPALGAGGRIVRVFRGDQGTEFAHLSVETGNRLYRASLDMNNPHMMGLDAREVFYLDDKIVIVEGQEDVIFVSKALASVGLDLNGTVFGWGAGGAEKIELIAKVLDELRYKKVIGIVDANRSDLLPTLRQKFPNYHFEAIPADDIRSKPPVKPREARAGLLDDANVNVRPEHRERFSSIVKDANAYLEGKVNPIG